MTIADARRALRSGAGLALLAASVLAAPPLAAPALGRQVDERPGGSATIEPAFEVPPLPEGIDLDPALARSLEADWLTPEERADLRVRHGVWTAEDLEDPERAARAALDLWVLDHPALEDPAAPALLRAEAMLRRGEITEALELIDGDDSIAAWRLRTEALELLGRDADALAAAERGIGLADAIERSERRAADLTDRVRMSMVRARIEVRPSRTFTSMVETLAEVHQTLDRNHWPSRLVEARLLIEKNNRREGHAALLEVLARHPRQAEAWYLLGDLALGGLSFDVAEAVMEQLRGLVPGHPLAARLEADMLLMQDAPEAALEAIEPVLERWPRMREALAIAAAAEAISYDRGRLDAALARYDALSPGGGDALLAAGRALAFNRQYALAAELLEAAIGRRPAWPAPRVALGLLHMQWGRDREAIAALREAVRLDPFHKRAANSLLLIEDLTELYETVETEHFVIRHAPGVDAIVADAMAEDLDRLHGVVVERFGHEPDQRTVIELMPDHPRFAVRVTGMPGLYTFAASTGPVIAMEVPRDGRPGEHSGPYDWPRVLRHEYTHTVTLGQTSNRVPHWLTEAAAVQMELGPRDMDRCRLLAGRLEAGELFALDEIKWGFVRPQRAGDRALAYAQSHWMLEYMDETFGPRAVIELLDRFDRGLRQPEAFRDALGVSLEDFHGGFVSWARDEVRSWGLAPEPAFSDLVETARREDPELALEAEASRQARADVIVRHLTAEIGRPGDDDRLLGEQWPPLILPEIEITDDRLAAWLEDHPDHPDLWELRLRRALGVLDDADEAVLTEELVGWLERYAELRPVDGLPHRRLARHWLAVDQPARAVPHLAFLDAREQYSPVYALQLARIHRATGDAPAARAAIDRALTIAPYLAPSRELAAAISIEAGRLEEARRHVEALTLLEPDRSLHRRRLEAIDQRLGRGAP